MMYSFSLLLVAAILTVGSSATTTALRRSRTQTQRQTQTQYREEEEEERQRRHLMQEITCKLFLEPSSFAPTPEYPNGFSEDTWVCELEDDDSDRVGIRFVELAHNFNEALVNATSGLSTITLSEAIIDADMMYLPSDAKLRLVTEGYNEHQVRRRQLTASTGNLNALVVRIVGSEGDGPKSSVQQLKNDFFTDSVSLKTQFEACSYNKLKIKPYSNTYNGIKINDGVYELNLDINSKNKPKKDIEKAANKAMERDFGKISQSPFDLVMYCFPPGDNANWGAAAYVNGQLSVYSSEWCHKVSAMMHEVGHNLNLDHSSEDNKEYGDWTGMMGISYNEDDTKMCYNPAKNFQLGWYTDQQESHNPLTYNEGVKTFTLNGVADYKKNDDALVVLQLNEVSKNSDYYVGYNRKAGINAHVKEDGDKVTVQRKDKGPMEYGKSYKVADLEKGQSYTIKNFNGQGKDVKIRFNGVISERDAIVDIIDVDREGPPPPPAACTEYTVEIKTDDYPGDTSWDIVEQGGLSRIFGTSPKYTEKLKVYRNKVCLEYNTQYEFTINDNFKDGLCCQQGKGYYRLLDPNNKIIFERLEGQFTTDKKIFNVGNNPNPPQNPQPTKAPTKRPTKRPTKSPTKRPTKRPTKSPTKAPKSSSDSSKDDSDCIKHTIQIVTDDYPGDSSWSILKNNDEVYVSTAMTAKRTEYNTEVCLKPKKKYKFVMVDNYKDGLCCSHGNGSYKVLDSKGKVVIDSKNKDKDFHIKEHKFKTGKIESAEDDSNDGECKNKQSKFKVKGGEDQKTCGQHKKDGNCDEKSNNGKPVWMMCPKACDRCDDV